MPIRPDLKRFYSPGLMVTISGPRGEEWQRAVGCCSFPVTADKPTLVDVPGSPTLVPAFFLDVGRMDVQTVEAIALYLSRKFRTQSPKAIALDMLKRGCPILADNCMVFVCRYDQI